MSSWYLLLLQVWTHAIRPQRTGILGPFQGTNIFGLFVVVGYPPQCSLAAGYPLICSYRSRWAHDPNSLQTCSVHFTLALQQPQLPLAHWIHQPAAAESALNTAELIEKFKLLVLFRAKPAESCPWYDTEFPVKNKIDDFVESLSVWTEGAACTDNLFKEYLFCSPKYISGFFYSEELLAYSWSVFICLECDCTYIKYDTCQF